MRHHCDASTIMWTSCWTETTIWSERHHTTNQEDCACASACKHAGFTPGLPRLGKADCYRRSSTTTPPSCQQAAPYRQRSTAYSSPYRARSCLAARSLYWHYQSGNSIMLRRTTGLLSAVSRDAHVLVQPKPPQRRSAIFKHQRLNTTRHDMTP